MFNLNNAINQIKADLKSQNSLTNSIGKNVILVMHYGKDKENQRLEDIFRKDGEFHTQRARLTEAKKVLTYGQNNKIPVGNNTFTLTEFIDKLENNKINPSLTVLYKAIRALEKQYQESDEYKTNKQERQDKKYVKDVVQFAFDNGLFKPEWKFEKPNDFMKMLSNPFSQNEAEGYFKEFELTYAQAQTDAQITAIIDNGDNIDIESVKMTLQAVALTDEQGFLELANYINTLMDELAQVKVA